MDAISTAQALALTTLIRAVRGRASAWAEETGQAVVLAAALMTALCGVGAITVDIGLLVHERVAIQNAVEAGALAGAQQLPGDAANAEVVARDYVLDNEPDLPVGNVNVSFRCVVGDRNFDGLPDLSDIPLACNPGANATWTTRGGISASPCIPAEGDACNVIVVQASTDVAFSFAGVLGIPTGSTGVRTSAACRGVCGGPPTGPVDLLLVVDRTGSMSSGDITNVRNASRSILRLYNPELQWVGMGLLGPSQTGGTCDPSHPCAYDFASARFMRPQW